MAVVTISRHIGSLGSEVAQTLAKTMSYRLLDRESLEKSLAAYGISALHLERYDEKKPSFWEVFSSERDRYLHYLKTVFLEAARQGNCVILGRGGQVLMGDVPGVLHVRCVAPLELRVARVQERYSCGNRQAEQIIRQSDHDRYGFHKFFFNVNWESPSLYDVILNTKSFSLAGAVAVLQEALDALQQGTDPQRTAAKLADLWLAQQVETGILYQALIPVNFLETSAQDGVVTLKGVVSASANIDRCQAAAGKVPGVKKVVNLISVIDNYLAM